MPPLRVLGNYKFCCVAVNAINCLQKPKGEGIITNPLPFCYTIYNYNRDSMQLSVKLFKEFDC